MPQTSKSYKDEAKRTERRGILKLQVKEAFCEENVFEDNGKFVKLKVVRQKKSDEDTGGVNCFKVIESSQQK